MNFPITIAGSRTLRAFVAHITGGIKQSIAFALAAIYFLWGCSWLLQLFALKRKPGDASFSQTLGGR